MKANSFLDLQKLGSISHNISTHLFSYHDTNQRNIWAWN